MPRLGVGLGLGRFFPAVNPKQIAIAGVTAPSTSSAVLSDHLVHTFYLKNALAAGGGAYGSLQDGGTPPTTANSGTGAIMGTKASSWFGRIVYATILPTSAFTGATVSGPNGADCWRSENPMTGTFDVGTFVFKTSVIARTTTVDGSMCIRTGLWKGPNADGTSATLIGALGASTATSNLTTATAQNLASNTSPGVTIAMNNEYLFFQSTIQLVTASSSANADMLFVIDALNSVVTTPPFG